MIPGNVVLVAFSFPPNRRFYKEIISYQAKLFCVVLKATGEHNNLATATTTKTRKQKRNRFNKQNKNTQCLHRRKNVVKRSRIGMKSSFHLQRSLRLRFRQKYFSKILVMITSSATKKILLAFFREKVAISSHQYFSQIEDPTQILLIDVSAIFLAVQTVSVIKRSVVNDPTLAKLQDIERILGE